MAASVEGPWIWGSARTHLNVHSLVCRPNQKAQEFPLFSTLIFEPTGANESVGDSSAQWCPLFGSWAGRPVLGKLP